MRKIPLTQGKEALVDDDLFETLSEYKWYATSEKHNNTYARSKRVGFMHHFVWGKKTLLDHINGNGLDNRRENLRGCTHIQNMYNRAPIKNRGSSFKGVSYEKLPNLTKPWRARITVNGKIINLGVFYTELEAAKAYNEAAVIYFKDFAYLNSIEGN